MFWVVLRYAGISENWAVVEVVTVWGYAMFVWIPVSVRTIYLSLPVQLVKWTRFQILCIIPVALLRWVLSGIGFALSGYFLVANIYPVLVSVRHPSLLSPMHDLKPISPYAGEPEASTASNCCGSSATRSHCTLIQGLIL